MSWGRSLSAHVPLPPWADCAASAAFCGVRENVNARVTWVRTGNRLPGGRRGVEFYMSPVWGQACPLARREKFGGLGFEFRDLISTQFPQATDKVFIIILFNTCNLTAAITNKKLYIISVAKQKKKDPKPCDFVLVIYIWHEKFPVCLTFPRRL